MDEILLETGINGEELELIKKGSRMRKLTAAKETYVKDSWDQGYSLGEIARHINISTAAVFKYRQSMASKIPKIGIRSPSPAP